MFVCPFVSFTLAIVLSVLLPLAIVLSVLLPLAIVLSVLLPLAIVLSVLLRFTDSDCTFGIFKFFLHNVSFGYRNTQHSIVDLNTVEFRREQKAKEETPRSLTLSLSLKLRRQTALLDYRKIIEV